MESWQGWRKRFKEWKQDNKISDADIADAMGVERPTVNSWLNKREPNLSDFMGLCAATGADPGLILFGQAILRDAVPTESAAHRAMVASPTATPGHKQFVSKLSRFKRRKRGLQRVIVVSRAGK